MSKIPTFFLVIILLKFSISCSNDNSPDPILTAAQCLISEESFSRDNYELKIIYTRDTEDYIIKTENIFDTYHYVVQKKNLGSLSKPYVLQYRGSIAEENLVLKYCCEKDRNVIKWEETMEPHTIEYEYNALQQKVKDVVNWGAGEDRVSWVSNYVWDNNGNLINTYETRYDAKGNITTAKRLTTFYSYSDTVLPLGDSYNYYFKYGVNNKNVLSNQKTSYGEVNYSYTFNSEGYLNSMTAGVSVTNYTYVCK